MGTWRNRAGKGRIGNKGRQRETYGRGWENGKKQEETGGGILEPVEIRKEVGSMTREIGKWRNKEGDGRMGKKGGERRWENGTS